jgi:hypothetical protein
MGTGGVGWYYVVNFAPRPFGSVPNAWAVFDWAGVFAPPGHQYEQEYRGKVYIFEHPTVTLCTDANPRRSQYGVLAGGIDRVANTVTHERAHRDLWLQAYNWAGFSEIEIGGPGYWFPANAPWDADGDYVADFYEQLHSGDFHFSPNSPYAVERWWTGNPNASEQTDIEMHARLWGEWPGYREGSLDTQDWSAGGRQDY